MAIFKIGRCEIHRLCLRKQNKSIIPIAKTVQVKVQSIAYWRCPRLYTQQEQLHRRLRIVTGSAKRRKFIDNKTKTKLKNYFFLIEGGSSEKGKKILSILVWLWMLHIVEVSDHTVMQGLQHGWIRKDAQHLPKLWCANLFIMSHIPEALRHTVMPGLQPGWTRKDIQHFYQNFMSQNIFYIACPRSAQVYAGARAPIWVNHDRKHNIIFAS